MATNESLITRVSLAAQVRRALADRILSGQIAPGSRINESHLADELGVSRTPLREALAGLERDGFLISEPGRGYFVSGLTAEEANELYPILGMLEAAAVRMSGALSESHLKHLAALNAALAEVDDNPDDAIAANFAWHERLIAHCPNTRLCEMVRGLWAKVRRYEYAFFAPGHARVQKSAELHDAIAQALSANDADRAAKLVDEHWLTDLDRLLPRIRRGEG